jgi:hypothetical protein
MFLVPKSIYKRGKIPVFFSYFYSILLIWHSKLVIASFLVKKKKNKIKLKGFFFFFYIYQQNRIKKRN